MMIMSCDATARGSKAALLALGIVYGDLGTSPLYTVQAIALTMGGQFTPDAALGSLSLIVWALIITVSVKYCWIVMSADNQGEGGILALMIMTGARWKGSARSLIVMGLFGAALLYGDGMITPGISVLSAVEGLNVATGLFVPYTTPMAVAILVLLFALQKRGTGSVGRAFGPIMLIWFVTIAILGIGGIWRHPEVLKAINPVYGLRLLVSNGGVGLTTLGAVFLALTGAEALYADMGQVGRRPIRTAWYSLVFPALILNYAGQIGNVLDSGRITNPFFEMAPVWALYPLVALATMASIIASQAIISGCFSMTEQATQLGWLPAIRIKHTSADQFGQIYVPVVNWAMMTITVLLVVGFGSADRLAGAYGTAVSVTMVLTTVLLYRALQTQWRHWPVVWLAALIAIFLIVDLSFFMACVLKIGDGGWIPLSIGGLLFGIMATWHSGAESLRLRDSARSRSSQQFLRSLDSDKIVRVNGAAIFLTRLSEDVPPVVVDYVRRTGSLQKIVVLLSVNFDRVPRVAAAGRVRIAKFADDFWRINVHFGFREDPDLPAALLALTDLDGPQLSSACYFIESHDVVSGIANPLVDRLRTALFAFMLRNSARAIDQFKMPTDTLVELGCRLEL
ncbi:potassium transporter Kup [Tardiphaga sp. 862_B3_N4_1]|uniref:potassium transporter Kup n=1 Tax=Tardiphaga sp. 862_B3_N4_1 TaxID=3240764 RepID=UPI003F2813B8